jgi:hypothetical protein
MSLAPSRKFMTHSLRGCIWLVLHAHMHRSIVGAHVVRAAVYVVKYNQVGITPLDSSLASNNELGLMDGYRMGQTHAYIWACGRNKNWLETQKWN